MLDNLQGGFYNNEEIRGDISGDIVGVNLFSDLSSATYEYRDFSGEVQTPNTLFMDDGIDISQLKRVSYHDIIHEINEARMSINIVNPSNITNFVEKVMEKINE